METIFDSILKMCVCSYPENDCPVVSSTNSPSPNSSNSQNPTVSNKSINQPFFKNWLCFTWNTKGCDVSDDYSPDPTDCRKFFRCANGILYSFTCAPGTAFDPIMKICNYEHLVTACNNNNTTNSPNPTVSNKSIEQPFF